MDVNIVLVNRDSKRLQRFFRRTVKHSACIPEFTAVSGASDDVAVHI